MIEEVNLAKELIKATPKAVADTASDVWGLILGDRIAYYRRRNALRLSQMLQAEAERLGTKIDPSRVPDQFAFEWAEAATKKSDETIQHMFARLLANAGTEDGSCDERLIYSLKEMSAEDAVLFNTLYGDRSFRRAPRDHGLSADGLLRSRLEINVALALDNLLRIRLVREFTGLVQPNFSTGRFTRLSLGSEQRTEITTRRLIRPSALGELLYKQVVQDGE